MTSGIWLLACGTQIAEFVEAGVGDGAPSTPCASAQQRSRCDPHRDSVRLVGGLAGRRSDASTMPVGTGGSDVSIDEPRSGVHVPTECLAQISCRLEMGGDERSILVGSLGVAVLGSRRRAADAEPNGRPSAATPGRPCESSGAGRRTRSTMSSQWDGSARHAPAPRARVESNPRSLSAHWPPDPARTATPITAAAFRSCLASAVNLSMRDAMAACSVGGTATSAKSPRRTYAPASPSITFRSARSRTIS